MWGKSSSIRKRIKKKGIFYYAITRQNSMSERTTFFSGHSQLSIFESFYFIGFCAKPIMVYNIFNVKEIMVVSYFLDWLIAIV